MSGREEELLSAYIDGELSVDERASVEQWLADDVAARELMDELAETSSLVRSLPRPAAPPDLRDEVLSRLRAAHPSPATAAVSRPLRRRRVIWLASSAAGLLLAVIGLYRSWQPADVFSIAENQPSGVADGGFRGEEFGRTAEVTAFGLDAQPSSGLSRQGGEEALAMTAATSDSFAYEPQEVVEAARTNADLLQQDLELALEQGIAPVPGEGYEQLGQVGDQVVIFRYRVVDTQDMLDKVQVVLTQNGIVQVDPEGEASLSEDDADGQLEAIYLDTPAMNFNTAVTEISNFETVTAVMTNTISGENISRNGLVESVQQEAERLGELGRRPARSEARTREVDGDELTATPAAEPVSPNSSDAPENASKPDDQAVNPPLGLRREFATSPARDSGGQQGSAQDAKSADAYQVRVLALKDLVEELKDKPDGFFNRLDKRPAVAGTTPAQMGKQRWHAWNLPTRNVPGPPLPDRVRAVILLVPENAE